MDVAHRHEHMIDGNVFSLQHLGSVFAKIGALDDVRGAGILNIPFEPGARVFVQLCPGVGKTSVQAERGQKLHEKTGSGAAGSSDDYMTPNCHVGSGFDLSAHETIW